MTGVGGPAHFAGVEDLALHGVDLADPPPARPKAPLAIDEWEFEHDLHQLQGLVAAAKAGRTAPTVRPPQGIGQPTFASHGPSLGNVPAPAHRKKSRPRSSLLAWIVMSLGLMALICGAVLLAMSFATGKGELWSLGMPITVAGQVALLLGLVLQLERVWQGSRYAADVLDEVDQRLSDLKQTTTMLGVTHGSASQAFYAHMAEGASPHLLLADLKGQLDLLAVRMSQRG